MKNLNHNMINDYLISKTEFWEFCIIQGLDSRKNIGTPAIAYCFGKVHITQGWS